MDLSPDAKKRIAALLEEHTAAARDVEAAMKQVGAAVARMSAARVAAAREAAATDLLDVVKAARPDLADGLFVVREIEGLTGGAESRLWARAARGLGASARVVGFAEDAHEWAAAVLAKLAMEG